MPTVARFDDIDWTTPPVTADLSDEYLEVARRIQRKGIFAGEGGFFLSHVTMPAGLVGDLHSHSHSELFVILDGTMEFRTEDGETTTLRATDAVAIEAEEVYGFTIGADGVAFLLIRTGQASHKIAG